LARLFAKQFRSETLALRNALDFEGYRLDRLFNSGEPGL
jgi:hypothetical protein